MLSILLVCLQYGYFFATLSTRPASQSHLLTVGIKTIHLQRLKKLPAEPCEVSVSQTTHCYVFVFLLSFAPGPAIPLSSLIRASLCYTMK